ncbi:hypothetical protein AUR04nite_32810 [Glutamicibacter uratoxydans]|uniref:Uncharacterized protein n=1 Tax=Glutamicibacter uratoxydans TaxID=43667 RepID=A0A4Y4DQY4_GLUUR|nr:hypothetical protein [Glutamicibacter uratoxydans]GED07749.1 hypothetical protein AUR04nite_32810 [Glutamicibacter uratoxydans]
MNSEQPLTPEQQLEALGRAQADMDRAIGYGSRLMGWYCIVVGLAVGALAAVLQLYRPDENKVGFFIVMGLYVLVILGSSLAYRKLYRSLPQGYSKRYGMAFGLSIGLYAASVALLAAQITSWIAMLLIFLIVAAPLVLTGIKMVRE